MSEKVIILYDSHYKRVLEAALDKKIEDVKWYSVDSMTTQLYEIAVTIMQDGCVTSNARVFVLVGTYKRRKYIWKMLLTIGYSEEQLVNVYQFYWEMQSQMRYRRIMSHTCDILDGIVLGISHGKCGIDVERLPGRWVNLCCSSQDIYYNYKTLCAVLDEYNEQIKSVKYIVIDMFDYTYFNYDVLMSSECETYLESSGFLGETRNGMSEKRNIEQINEELIHFWQEGREDRIKKALFEKVFPEMKIADKNWYGTWKDDLIDQARTLSQKEIEDYRNWTKFSAIQTKIYESTITFQTEAFQKMLQRITEINSDIHILGVLLPKYIVAEQMEAELNKVWKEVFVPIVREMENTYKNFAFFDLKGMDIVQQSRAYWWDMTHLNKEGARIMTEYISTILTAGE